MNPLHRKAWSSYLVGAGIGVLSWPAFLTANRPLRITTAFEQSAVMIEQAAAPELVSPYLEANTKENKSPKIGWEWMLVLGVFVGAYINSSWIAVLERWNQRVSMVPSRSA